jgi:flagellar protein FliS
MNQALSSYQKNQISGMSQKDLIVFLYSGAVNFLRQAQDHLKTDSPAEFSDAIERVHRIIYHLYTTLDFEKGGEIAEKLGALYTFIIGQLYIVNSTKNENIISDLLIIISDLKEGWQGLNLNEVKNHVPRVGVMPPGSQTVVSAKV